MALVHRTSASPASALLALALCLASCAPARPPPPLPPRPMERSSVDVLLRNRGELGLSDGQVLRLEAIDEAREAQAAALRNQFAERKRASEEKADRPADIGTGSGRPGPGAGAGTSHALGSTAGPGSRGGRTSPLGNRKEDALTRLRARLDELDTRAYADAVTQVLSEAQRGPAEKLASAYREALFDYQEALRRRGGAPPED